MHALHCVSPLGSVLGLVPECQRTDLPSHGAASRSSAARRARGKLSGRTCRHRQVASARNTPHQRHSANDITAVAGCRKLFQGTLGGSDKCCGTAKVVLSVLQGSTRTINSHASPAQYAMRFSKIFASFDAFTRRSKCTLRSVSTNALTWNISR